MRSEDLDQSAELRRQAEVILAKISLAKNGRSKQWDELSSEDQSRVLHELEVHQIEVEMQNDELRQLGEKLHSSRARYFNLYDQAPLG